MPDIIVTKPKEKALVKRHNHLIEARYRLTLQEQRLLLWLFSEIKRIPPVMAACSSGPCSEILAA